MRAFATMDASSETLKFELLPYKVTPKKQLPTAGVKGDVGHFGSVVVERCPLYRTIDKGMDTARLSGPDFPETVFRGNVGPEGPPCSKRS
ncbi:hypothetical protein SHKM778_90480 [Streptomyces sp. KM77-8]|uniref:Uncharacterized protein n=1 Tax=Streptomyces haneummycinicus TaxID=3074435 RepID=A0AAT9HYC6_9ACTN